MTAVDLDTCPLIRCRSRPLAEAFDLARRVSAAAHVAFDESGFGVVAREGPRAFAANLGSFCEVRRGAATICVETASTAHRLLTLAAESDSFSIVVPAAGPSLLMSSCAPPAPLVMFPGFVLRDVFPADQSSYAVAMASEVARIFDLSPRFAGPDGVVNVVVGEPEEANGRAFRRLSCWQGTGTIWTESVGAVEPSAAASPFHVSITRSDARLIAEFARRSPGQMGRVGIGVGVLSLWLETDGHCRIAVPASPGGHWATGPGDAFRLTSPFYGLEIESRDSFLLALPADGDVRLCGPAEPCGLYVGEGDAIRRVPGEGAGCFSAYVFVPSDLLRRALMSLRPGERFLLAIVPRPTPRVIVAGPRGVLCVFGSLVPPPEQLP